MPVSPLSPGDALLGGALSPRPRGGSDHGTPEATAKRPAAEDIDAREEEEEEEEPQDDEIPNAQPTPRRRPVVADSTIRKRPAAKGEPGAMKKPAGEAHHAKANTKASSTSVVKRKWQIEENWEGCRCDTL